MNKLTSEQIASVMQLAKVCTRCNGDGYYPDHALHDHPYGDCCGQCPVQIECDACNGEGSFINPNSLRTALEQVLEWEEYPTQDELDKAAINFVKTHCVNTNGDLTQETECFDAGAIWMKNKLLSHNP